MAFGDLTLIPGVNVERTPTLLQAGYNSTELVRFRDGLVEKIGGWALYTPATTVGLPRALHAWRDLNNNNWLAEGTDVELNVIDVNGQITDITPEILVSNIAPDFSTTINSPTVQISDTNGPNPVSIFDRVFLNTPVSVGGLVLWGLYPISGVAAAQIYDITASGNATSTVASGGTLPIFTTTAGDFTVNVNIVGHGVSADDIVFFNMSTNVGGLTIVGRYTVITVVDADNFTITGNIQAVSNDTQTMNGGNVQFVYYIVPGPPPTGTGYGFGAYGEGPYGGAVTGAPAPVTGTPIVPGDWSLSNWGQILIASPTGDGIFQYDPRAAFAFASIIPTAPPKNNGAFIATAAQILVCWGSTSGETAIGVEQDPLLVRWSDQGDFTNFVVSSLTQAGSFRIPTGNEIVGAMQVSLQMLFWTDIELWQASYIQPPLVFGFNKLGSGCGLISQHAACQIRGAVYWMGQSNFFVLSGQGVEPLRCPVWDSVFQNLDFDDRRKCWAWANSVANEVWFFYPTETSETEVADSYVKFNLVEQSWDVGFLDRSAGIDISILGPPIAASANSQIFQHENTLDAAGEPISWSFTTGYFYIAEGEEFAFVDQIIPDFKFNTFSGQSIGPASEQLLNPAMILMTVNTVNYPGDPIRQYGPYTITPTTQFIFVRIRARQFQLTFSGNDLSTFFRLGKVRFRFAPDGRR